MPPQRRKIVPPTTTTKGRRKMSGAASETGKPERPTVAESDADSATTPASAPAPAADTPQTETPAGDTPKTEAPKSETPKSETPQTGGETGSTGKKSLFAKKRAGTTAQAGEPARTDDPAGAENSTTTEESAGASLGSTRSGVRWVHVAIVGLLAVVFGLFAVVAAFRPFADVDNRAWVDQAATQEVTAAATEAVQTLFTYNPDTIDEDFDRARTLLNDSMREQFDSTAETTKTAVQQTNTGIEASVTDVGVTRLEDDSAELLLNLNVSRTVDGSASGSTAGPVTVNLEKVDGRWILTALDDQG